VWAAGLSARATAESEGCGWVQEQQAECEGSGWVQEQQVECEGSGRARGQRAGCAGGRAASVRVRVLVGVGGAVSSRPTSFGNGSDTQR